MSDKELLESHKNKIIKELKFKHEPIVLYGDEAFSFFRKSFPVYHNKSDKQILKRARGYFHHVNLSQDYVNTGVICIFNEHIGTLAHELCHAKQFQDNNKWMESRKWMKLFYKIGYAFYPTEREAFKYAENYLKSCKLDELASDYKLHIRKVKIKNVFQWCATLFLFSMVYAMF
ncbi:hypothetical protein HUN92_13740 [Bacillus firmus]|uniref:hypothetical protein n=1 Tax=Cytobacillus firmus TaxID=1399 RepID=UPI0015804F91|nr:hypothetical protein [Cytobacillus firmus]NUH84782.1 hypothetical protein [Cytobacillus firmus]